ncbi:MAG: hypothetical protein KIT84_01465 [Labilithrix sp.]|nr:hypothetical protein [Labilithrix sp.]MCW5809655.1 hypothetical protein [Labilithrix sp.]
MSIDGKIVLGAFLVLVGLGMIVLLVSVMSAQEAAETVGAAEANAGVSAGLVAGAAFALPGAFLIVLGVRSGMKGPSVRDRVALFFSGGRLVVGLAIFVACALVVALLVLGPLGVVVVPIPLLLLAFSGALTGLILAGTSLGRACRACGRALDHARYVLPPGADLRDAIARGDARAVAAVLAESRRIDDATSLTSRTGAIGDVEACPRCSQLCLVRATEARWFVDADARAIAASARKPAA